MGERKVSLVSGVLGVRLVRGKAYVERERRWNGVLASSVWERKEREERKRGGEWR